MGGQGNSTCLFLEPAQEQTENSTGISKLPSQYYKQQQNNAGISCGLQANTMLIAVFGQS